jgi:epoxyqueuosine reductase QueG
MMKGELSKIINLLGKRGIPLSGISEPKELAGITAQFSPASILKDCRSVLCHAVPIPKGILHSESNSSMLFWRFSNMTYRFLDTVSDEICMLLEAHGHLAAPIYSCFPWKVCGKKFYGLLPLAYLSQECGIGKLTRSGLVGNARFGTRLLLGGVITSAALEKNAKAPDQLCPSDCFLCRESCPAGAIDQSGRVDHNLCVRHSGANPLLAHLLADREIKAKFGFDTLLNTVGVDDHGMYTCSRCLEVCPLNR